MGANDLHSYFMSNKRALRYQSFRDSKLIIDGSDLYHTLYFRARLDQEHGGEYHAFEKEVCIFFRNLTECKIQPYVVLDGVDGICDEKFVTLRKKAETRIRKAHNLSMGRPRNVLPTLIKTVFMQFLSKHDVPFIQCVFKAPWEIGALANEWNCPVLSNTTDFYILDIKAGFLPLCRFQWNNMTSVKQSNKKFIPVKMFSVETLCAGLMRVNKYLLPIFATILGNDFANLGKGMFLKYTQRSGKHEETRHIDGLLRWLSYFQDPAEAIYELVSSIPNPDDSADLIKALTEGMQKYWLSPSSIAQFFISGKPQSRLPGPLEYLPEWTVKLLAKGKLSSIIVDVLAMQRIVLNFPVEDSQCCSSNLTSRPIRQAIYGLLLCTRQQNSNSNITPDAEVEEYDRQGLALTCSKVAAVLPSQAIPDLHLETLWETPWHKRLQVFLDTLCVSQAPERLFIPPNLQLAVYVTCYWLKHGQPEPRPEFFWALLTGLVYGELAKDPRTEKLMVPKRLKNLKRHKEKAKKMPLDLEAAHAYNQWQCILRDSLCLSQLLANPVPEPECAWLYSGVLVHGVTEELKKGTAPEALLSGVPQALQLYQQLKEAVEYELDDDLGARVRADRERRRKHEEHVDMFDHLTDRNSEDDDNNGRGRKSKGSNHDDVIYEETCTIRTRHKSRSRKTDPKSKKYERSCWE